jgi:hypothetical protein
MSNTDGEYWYRVFYWLVPDDWFDHHDDHDYYEPSEDEVKSKDFATWSKVCEFRVNWLYEHLGDSQIEFHRYHTM